MEVISMKYKKIIILCLGLIILLGVFYKVGSDDNQIGQWSKEEKLEDFNYLYNILKENYPYFEVLKRKYGYDWLAQKEEFGTMIANTENDLEYYNALDEIIRKINQAHTNLISPSSYNTYKDVYNNVTKGLFNDIEEYEKATKPWKEVLNNSVSEKTYMYMQDLLQQHEENTYEEDKNKGNNNENTKTEQDNVTLKIIRDNKIAYVKINSFGAENISKEGPTLMEFWNKIKNYPYLIIDITENGGGSDFYWRDYIVGPLINEAIECETYSVYRGGEYSLPFIKARQDKLYPICFCQ
jgi:hemoglobin-like flavoprotein